MNRFLLFAAIFILSAATWSSARVFTWIGGTSQDWNNPANWQSEGAATFPRTSRDTARFDASAKGHCRLTVSVQINSIQCLAGFAKGINLLNRTLRLTGDADFSHGRFLTKRAKIVFRGRSGAVQRLIPPPAGHLTSIIKEGASTVKVVTNRLKVGALTIRSGTWHWAAGPDTVMAGIAVRGPADMVFDNGISLNILAGNGDFQGVGRMVLAGNNTISFAGNGVQLFFPKAGVEFPVISKSGGGELNLSTNPLTSQGIILAGGTWNWAGVGPDTVGFIRAEGGTATMVLSGATVCIKSGDVDFRDLGNLDAKTGAFDFTGASAQYFISKPTLPEPTVRHSGSGALRFGPRPGIGEAAEGAGANKTGWAPAQLIIHEKCFTLEVGSEMYFPPRSLLFRKKLEIGAMGMVAGIFLPVKLQNWQMWFHARAVFHGTKALDTGVNYEGYNYLTGINELLIGKPFLFKNVAFEFTPFIGSGIGEGLSIRMKNGGIWLKDIHPHFFVSGGLWIRKRFEIDQGTLYPGILLYGNLIYLGVVDSRMKISASFVLGI